MFPRWSTALVLLAVASPAFAEDKTELFTRDRVWTFHLRIQASEWDAMQPTGGRMPFGFPGVAPAPEKKPEQKDGEKRDTKTSAFGMSFPYGKGDLEFEGNVWKDVGVRFKGNSTYNASSRGNKRPFKLDLDRHVSGQRFRGYSNLNLQNDVFDASHMRQAVAFELFHQAGVPAPRTSFVQLYLSIPGKQDKQYLGVYTLVEEVNKGFLKREFGSSKGLLLKPEGIQGLPYMGNDWSRYANRLRPKTEVKEEHTNRFIAFAKLLNQSSDATFRKEIGDYLDVDQFLRFLAVNVLITNLDSFIGLGHNYYLYLDPKTNRFCFIPWDLDLSFGGFGMAGSTADQTNLSISKPTMGRNRLVDRLLAIPEYDKAYRAHLKKLTETAFSPKKMRDDIDALEKVLAKAEGRSVGVIPSRFAPGGMSRALKQYIEKRVESVTAQLDGKSEGVLPAMRGFGGGGGPAAALARPIIEKVAERDRRITLEGAVAGAQKLFDQVDADRTGSLDEKALTRGLEKLLPAPPAGGGGAGFRPPSQAATLAAAIFKRADADKDGKLTKDELVAATRSLFRESDANRDGKIDERELTDGLARLLPAGRPPFGFGREGGRP